MCAQGNTYFYLLFAFTSPLDCCRMKVIVILCDLVFFVIMMKLSFLKSGVISFVPRVYSSGLSFLQILKRMSCDSRQSNFLIGCD